MKSAVFNANNTVRSAPSVFDTAGTGNFNADASSLPNGGFVVSYQDNQYTGHFDTTTAFFNAAGTRASFRYRDKRFRFRHYAVPEGAVSPDGYLFTTQTNALAV